MEPGGSPEAHALSQYLFEWQRKYTESLRAKLQACEDPSRAAQLTILLAECDSVYPKFLEAGYAKETES